MGKADIKKAIKEKKLVIGSNSVIRGLKKEQFKSVFYASNCPEDLINSLNRYDKIKKIQLENFGGNSLELGEICGKPFNINVVGIKK